MIKFYFDTLGYLANALALLLNFGKWILEININQTLAIIISLLAITFWAMKIYHQALETKKFKRDNKKK